MSKCTGLPLIGAHSCDQSNGPVLLKTCTMSSMASCGWHSPTVSEARVCRANLRSQRGDIYFSISYSQSDPGG